MNVRQISRYAGKENKRKPQRNKVCIVTTKRISIGKTHFINKQLKYTNISVFLVYLLVPLLVLICSLMCCVCMFFFHSFWNTLRAQPLHKFKLKRLLWLIYSCIQTYWLLIYCLDRTLKLPYTHISMPQYFNATHTHTHCTNTTKSNSNAPHRIRSHKCHHKLFYRFEYCTFELEFEFAFFLLLRVPSTIFIFYVRSLCLA